MRNKFRTTYPTMKLHFVLINAVAEALTDVFQNGKYADKVIERLLKSNPKWGSRDRAFIAETTYECVRWVRKLVFLREKMDEKTLEKGKILRGYDAANFKDLKKKDWLEIIGIHLTLKSETTLNLIDPRTDSPEFRQFDFKILKEKSDNLTERKTLQSIPDWLDELGENELGVEKWTAILSALNKPADVVLRVNTLKISVLDLIKKLNELDFETERTALATSALVLKKRANIFQNELFKNGFFEVQDAGSQTIAPFLQVGGGMRVVDACAGAGGKSLHLATIMENKGRIIALDTEGWKLDELKKRAKRNGIGIIETRPIETTKTIKRLHDSADRLLLDVPCSGLGVLRRNPDAKWKLSKTFLDEIRIVQQKILTDYAKMVRTNGMMVYATCSILPSENENQVQLFLANNLNFKLVEERKILPNTEGFDGFYMALLERVS